MRAALLPSRRYRIRKLILHAPKSSCTSSMCSQWSYWPIRPTCRWTFVIGLPRQLLPRNHEPVAPTTSCVSSARALKKIHWLFLVLRVLIGFKMSQMNVNHDNVFYRIQMDFDHFEDIPDPVWHHSCYSRYTSKTNVAYVCGGAEYSTPTSSTSPAVERATSRTRQSTAHAANFYTNLCLFCQRLKHNGSKKLSDVQTQLGAQSIQGTARGKEDDVFLRINQVDFLAVNAKYHKQCRAAYMNQRTWIKEMTADAVWTGF